MPVTLESIFREVPLVSDEKQFELQVRRPGAYLGLQALEHAYMNLQVHKHFGGVDDEGLKHTLAEARHLLHNAYNEEIGAQNATQAIKRIDDSLTEKLAGIKPAQGRGSPD